MSDKSSDKKGKKDKKKDKRKTDGWERDPNLGDSIDYYRVDLRIDQ